MPKAFSAERIHFGKQRIPDSYMRQYRVFSWRRVYPSLYANVFIHVACSCHSYPFMYLSEWVFKFVGMGNVRTLPYI